VVQKVCQYQESSLNRIKTLGKGRVFINFDYKTSTGILYICVKYSTCDLICDVISCCVMKLHMGKINVSDKIVIKK